MEIDIKKTDNGYQVNLVGRLDTPAAVEAQKDFGELIENADKKITIDCTELKYISSSGLRLFLMLRKETSAKGGHLTVINVNEDIKEVFKITGFLNLFEIKN
ncbi:MAG: STAS domain-containing protein [Prevotella sp.]|nr:STAS domain-containing protein [Prevotella sp.]